MKLKDLSDEPFILVNRKGNALLHDCFLYACRQSGFTPRIVQETDNDQLALGLVSSEMGIAVVFACLNKLYENRVDYLPLVEPRFEFEFAIYWRRGHSLALADNFIDAALRSGAR